MKKLSPIKQSIAIAMLFFMLLMMIGMLGSTVFADGPEDTGEAAVTAKADQAELDEAAAKLEKVINSQQSGILHIISIPFGYVVRGCSIISFGNYPIALLFYALAMKIILFPFGIKQQKNSIKQARLRPKEQAIREKYAGRNDKATQQKVQEEVMALYKRENFNPMGGCLPMLLQLPILFALYRVVYNPLRHVVGYTTQNIIEIGKKLVYNNGLTSTIRGDIDILGKLQNLSSADYTKVMSGVDGLSKNVAQSDLPLIRLFGVDLASSPTESLSAGKWLMVLIPILVFVSSYLSMKLTRKFTFQPQQAGDAAKSLKVMDFAMPALSAFFAFTFPALLGIYWIYQSLLAVAQQYILYKMFPLPEFTEEDYAKARKEILGKGQNKKKKNTTGKYNPKSLHHIDDDEDIPDGNADQDDDDYVPAQETLLNGEKLPEQKGAIPPAALKEDVPAPEKRNKKK